MRWHLWLDGPRPGWENMAVDLALLDRAEADGEGWLRLYSWAPHCLSFGRHEPAARRYGRERVRALGLDTVRRPTGGRAVWHAREITYAVTRPFERTEPIREAYLAIHSMLRDALVGLGVPARLAPATTRARSLSAGACFASAAGGEVTVGGRKLVGSAQLRRGRALLQHGSILLEDDQAMVAALSPASAPQARATSLAEALQRLVAHAEIAEAIGAAARAAFGGEWMQGTGVDPGPTEVGRHAPLFRSEAWTWTR